MRAGGGGSTTKTNHQKRHFAMYEFQFMILRQRMEKPSQEKPGGRQDRRWKTPPTGAIEVGIDGIFQEETRPGGWGAIGR
jgi:hypothetical protein